MDIYGAYIFEGLKSAAISKVWPVRGGICGNKMVILGDDAAVYDTIGEAYGAAGLTDTIKAQAAILGETLNFNMNKTITLAGGYDDCDYKLDNGYTTISGMTIGGHGKVIISNIIIR